MKYLRPTFTCPTGGDVNQAQWDLSFLSKSEFIKKYDITEKMYGRISDGETIDDVMASYRRIR